ncbi:hypothetical protein [Nocardia terpenica]|uniref:hypothetical protein n=1 Tax=Nocardia terpenica TaxID=455432 RepID=UPI0012FDEDEA|nr:hypothetical protein [Nocardia terpenica]
MRGTVQLASRIQALADTLPPPVRQAIAQARQALTQVRAQPRIRWIPPDTYAPAAHHHRLVAVRR